MNQNLKKTIKLKKDKQESKLWFLEKPQIQKMAEKIVYIRGNVCMNRNGSKYLRIRDRLRIEYQIEQ